MRPDVIAAGIVDRLVAGDAAPAVKALPIAAGWSGSNWGYARPNVSAYDFSRHDISANSVVALALKWIRRNIHLGKIVVGNEAADGTDRAVRKHPLESLLRRPNRVEESRRAVMSWKCLLGATADELALWGYAYWLKARNRLTGDVEEVYWVPNQLIEIVHETDPDRQQVTGPIRLYRYLGGYTPVPYDPRDVVHFRDGADPLCPYQGLSDLRRQIRNAAAVDFGERFTAASLRNGHGGKVLAPKESGVIITEGSPDEATMNRVSREIEGGLSGENVGRVIKATLPIDLIDLGLGPEEMALVEILDRPTSMILAALGLNGVVLGIPSRDQSTYENKKQAREDALRFGVAPIQDLIAEEVEAQLLPDFGDATPAATRVWWDRGDVPDLQQDPDAAATRAQVLFTAGLLPRDRALAAGGMEPVGGEEGGLYTGQPTESEAAAAADAAERIAGGGEFDEGDDFDEEDDLPIKSDHDPAKPRKRGSYVLGDDGEFHLVKSLDGAPGPNGRHP